MSGLEPILGDLPSGTRIDGRYTVRGLLGRGAQAVVYDGTHDELARPVAIKVLDMSWAGESGAVSRFLREARTASALSHSHIVDVSDLGRLRDGRPYLVMPKVPGVPLSEWLARCGRQPARRVARLLAGVASALDLIHARGFVHRDIKPDNLMFVQQGDAGETVVLLDFGIAVLTSANAPRVTQRNVLFGTPAYMPPEMWEGSPPDARGDIYALATVAFELITGVLPFDDDNPMQLLATKYRKQAPRLSDMGAGRFSAQLEAVFQRGLTRRSELRFGSASAWSAALLAAADGGELGELGELAGAIADGEAESSGPRCAGRRTPLGDDSGGSRARLSQRGVGSRADAWPSSAADGGAVPRVGSDEAGAALRSAPPAQTGRGDDAATASRSLTLRMDVRAYARPPQRAGRRTALRAALGRTRLASQLVQRVVRRRGLARGHTARAWLPLPAADGGGLGWMWRWVVLTLTALGLVLLSPSRIDTLTVVPRLLPQWGAPVQASRTREAEVAPGSAGAESDATSRGVATGSGNHRSLAPAARSPRQPSAPEGEARAVRVRVQPSAPEGEARAVRGRVQPSAPEGEARALRVRVQPSAPEGEARVVRGRVQPSAPEAEAPAVRAPEPQSATLQQQLANATAFLLHGQTERAIERFQAVVAVRPDSAPAWRGLGIALERKHEDAKALAAYRKYLMLAPRGLQRDAVQKRIHLLELEE